MFQYKCKQKKKLEEKEKIYYTSTELNKTGDTVLEPAMRLLHQFHGAFSQGQVPTHTGKFPSLAPTTL
jgi:hypothetical protein